MLWYTKSRRAQNPDDYETWIEGGVMPTMNAFDNGDIRTTILVGCFELWDFPTESVAPAMTSRRARDLIMYEEEPIVFYGNRVADIRIQDNKVNTLQARMGTGGNNMPLVAFDTQFGSNATTFEDLSPTLKASQQSPSVQGVSGMAVRRLTPVECERLQGFPDNWTEGQSDSARYKQMGNAVAVPVVEWIIGNICDTLKEAE
jgi:site-specific DNA-cytosine methylase